jgi:PAS domain S-box-containing protein
MTLQTILYFLAILLTCILSGFLAWYAWKHDQVPASRAYMRLTLSECLFALAEILSVLGPSSTMALFWFQARYLAGALMGIFWFVFALEYNGRRDWLSKPLLAGLFVIPLITQVLLWTNGMHGIWAPREVGFYRSGPLWMADVAVRVPGLGYLTHSFYILFLTLVGIALMFLTAWKMRREFLGQALLITGAGLIAFTFTINPLFNFLPKTEFNLFTPGIGLSVLLIALAAFRFDFLKRAPIIPKGIPQANRLDAQEKYSLAVLIFIFILFASGIAAVSYLTYQNYERQFLEQTKDQLSAIAELKTSGLVNWRAERMGDAEAIHNNPAFAELAQRSLENPDDAQAAQKLQTWVNALQTSYGYGRVFLLDTAGMERISSPTAPEAVPEELAKQASASLVEHQIIFLDFHRHPGDSAVHLSLLIPIFAPSDSQPLGVLVLRIDPNDFLYPYLQRWPVPSQSAETLLVRRDGEDVLYLNTLRHQQGAPLNLQFSTRETKLSAVKAVLGQTGIVSGMDYRGVEVIADVRAVPDSPWFLVSKMDTAEVYAPLRERLWQTVLFFGALVLVTGAILLLVWRQQRVRFYRRQAEAAGALRDSELRYRRLFEAARDGILILDAGTGTVIDVNPFLVEMLGFPHEEIVGKELWELGFFKDIAANKDKVLELQRKEYIRYENLPLETSDGRKFVTR